MQKRGRKSSKKNGTPAPRGTLAPRGRVWSGRGSCGRFNSTVDKT